MCFYCYKYGTKRYILYDLTSHDIFRSHNVIFYEAVFPFKALSSTASYQDSQDLTTNNEPMVHDSTRSLSIGTLPNTGLNPTTMIQYKTLQTTHAPAISAEPNPSTVITTYPNHAPAISAEPYPTTVVIADPATEVTPNPTIIADQSSLNPTSAQSLPSDPLSLLQLMKTLIQIYHLSLLKFHTVSKDLQVICRTITAILSPAVPLKNLLPLLILSLLYYLIIIILMLINCFVVLFLKILNPKHTIKLPSLIVGKRQWMLRLQL